MRAFPLTHAAHLPLTGDFHPLHKEFTKWLTWANGFAVSGAILVFATWYVWSRTNTEEVVPPGVKIVRRIDLPSPPSISEPSAPQLDVSEAVVSPLVGVVEPVPDELAQRSTIPPNNWMLGPFDPGKFVAGRDSIVIDHDESPEPGQFVVVDELPVPLSITTPAYPELAREAGFSATVKVQVLVGKDGKVK